MEHDSKFKVGDRVIVITDRWPDKQLGVHGTVNEVIHRYSDGEDNGKYEVHLDQMKRGTYFLRYASYDLDWETPPHYDMEADISLDEIHAFQELVNGA